MGSWLGYLRSAEDSKDHEAECEHHDQEHGGKGSGDAPLAERERVEDRGVDRVSCVAGSPVSQDVDDVEHAQGVQEVEYGRHGKYGPEQRQSNVEESLPARCAVDLCRFVVLAQESLRDRR